MKVGIVYDIKEDYQIDSDVNYCDFSNLYEMQHIQNLLEARGHYVKMIGAPCKFANWIKTGHAEELDIIMNFGEGFDSRNRESIVPALCEAYQIPYTFSDCFAMNLTLHKHHTLLFAESIGLHTPKGFLYIPEVDGRSNDAITRQFYSLNMQFPVVCKPNREGTSMGLSFVYSLDELYHAVHKIAENYHQEVRCDEYIKGHEIAVPILGTGEDARTLGIVEYQKTDGSCMDYYTTEMKQHGKHKTVYTSFGDKIDKKIIEAALKIHNSIPCYDLSRIDMRLKEGIPYILEVTPLPGLNPGSTFELCANKNGLSYSDLFEEILQSAMRRNQKGKRNEPRTLE